MTWLCGRMNYGIRLYALEQFKHRRTISDIQFVVLKSRDRISQSLLIPASVALWPEEDGSLIVVDAMNLPALTCKVQADF